MGFFERYKKLCADNGYEPTSQFMANAIGATRATISSWGKNGTVPKGETIAAIAEVFNVSSDYLLGRTDDPTDYTNPDLIAEFNTDTLEHFDGDVEKAVQFREAVDNDALSEYNGIKRVIQKFNRLDSTDQAKVEGVIEGLLMNYNKYNK